MDFGDAVEAESGGAPVTSSSSATAAAGGRRTSGGGGGVNGRGGGGRRRSSGGSRGDRLRQRRESTALCREGRQMLSCATVAWAIGLSVDLPAASSRSSKVLISSSNFSVKPSKKVHSSRTKCATTVEPT